MPKIKKIVTDLSNEKAKRIALRDMKKEGIHSYTTSGSAIIFATKREK